MLPRNQSGISPGRRSCRTVLESQVPFGIVLGEQDMSIRAPMSDPEIKWKALCWIPNGLATQFSSPLTRFNPDEHTIAPVTVTISHTFRGCAFLDIFSGASHPVSTALTLLGGDRVEPIDLIHGHDLLDDSLFESLLLLAASGKIGAALAAPYCSKHNRATLRRPGPAPEILDGVLTNSFASNWPFKKAPPFTIVPEYCCLQLMNMLA